MILHKREKIPDEFVRFEEDHFELSAPRLILVNPQIIAKYQGRSPGAHD